MVVTMSTGEKAIVVAPTREQSAVVMAPRSPKLLLSTIEKLKEWVPDTEGRGLVLPTEAPRGQHQALLVFLSSCFADLEPDVDFSSAGKRQAAVRSPESRREENEQLRSQVEALKSRVLQERKTAARETQRYDQLAVEVGALRTTLDKMLDRLAQRDAANSMLQAALAGKANGRLRMAESYQGEAIHVSDERVVVVFEVEGDLVEQTYNRKQFLDGRLPEKGELLAAYVHIAKLPAEEEKTVDGIISSHGADKPRKPRKNVVPLPRTF